MSRVGITVSKQDKVATSKNILDKLLDNNYPFLKAFKQGTLSSNITTAGTYTMTYTHGLGYIPYFLHYVAANPNQPTRKYIGCFAATGIGGSIGVDAYADNQVLKLSWTDTTPAGFKAYPYTITFYYYIFYDKIV